MVLNPGCKTPTETAIHFLNYHPPHYQLFTAAFFMAKQKRNVSSHAEQATPAFTSIHAAGAAACTLPGGSPLLWLVGFLH